MLHVTSARYIGGYRFELQFSTGHAGIVDLEDRLSSPTFSVLKDPAIFARGRLDSESHTLVWPNDLDLAPEYLLYRAMPDAPELQEQYVKWGYKTALAATAHGR